MQDITENADVRRTRHRDFARLETQAVSLNIQEFNSVEEIYFFMEQLLTEGFTEQHINLALNIFLRDAAFFEEEDL